MDDQENETEEILPDDLIDVEEEALDAEEGVEDSASLSEPKSTTQEEAAYLRRLIDRNVPVTVKVRGGQVFQGVIEYYDNRFIRVTRDGEPNLFIFKKDILYLSEA